MNENIENISVHSDNVVNTVNVNNLNDTIDTSYSSLTESPSTRLFKYFIPKLLWNKEKVTISRV
jgi:hypothetical protein